MASGPHPAATARTTEEARRGRSELEWREIRNPERARRATAAILAGPPAERERLLRAGFARAYAAFSRRDWEVNTLYLHPEDFLFEAANMRDALPDAPDKYYGIEGYLEAQELLLESWSDARIELADLLLCEQDRVVALMHWTGHGTRSGLPLEWYAVGEHEWRGGLCVRQTYWFNPERAVEELGLPPPTRP